MSDSFHAGFTNINLINFGIDSKFRNNGLMTYALQLTLDYMTSLEYGYACALVRDSNLSSKRVLEKCGFIKVSDNEIGSLHAKRLIWNEYDFNKSFKLD
jgi:RimJ/RimL family protein N-acetyltransferase